MTLYRLHCSAPAYLGIAHFNGRKVESEERTLPRGATIELGIPVAQIPPEIVALCQSRDMCPQEEMQALFGRIAEGIKAGHIDILPAKEGGR